MDHRYLMLALVAATICAAVPTTDLVIPENVDFATYSTSTSFIQAMSKSGGTEADCRTFADTTIRTIGTDVTSEQGILNAEDTGEDCAEKGQDGVANAQGKKDAANKDQLAKQGVAATTLNKKKTACTASVAFNVNLDTLESSECYDTTKEQSYINAKSTCASATSAMTKADEAVNIAKTTVKDGQQDYDNAVASAAQLKSACHCGVKKEQAQAWTAASEATAAHAADWKQAHEVICALDPTISCDELPDCPAVEQVTLSNDVSNEKCTQAQIDAPSSEEAGRSYTKKAGTYCYGTGMQAWYLTAEGPTTKVERGVDVKDLGIWSSAACKKQCDETTGCTAIMGKFDVDFSNCYTIPEATMFSNAPAYAAIDCYVASA